MEEKINNQKIFSYLPSIIIKIILETPLKDKDIFLDTTNKRLSSRAPPKYFKSPTRLKSIFINPNVFPIETILPSSLIMNIKLHGFRKLMSTLIIKDAKNLKEKLISEYLSIIIPRILLKISGIIAENGGEIVKYNDYEITAVWINTNINNPKSNKFIAKLGMISGIEIMKKVDKTEISKGVKLEVSIGMSIGDISCVFFGGERKRSEFVILGEAMEKALKCLDNCLPHEIIISKELYEIFKKGDEITIMEIHEDNEYFSLFEFNEEKLRDFSSYKGLKLNINFVYMNKLVYENLANKVHIISSILPQGLIKYLDVGLEGNLQEINVLTVATILLNLSSEINNDLHQIQNLIFDIQKAIYLTFGTLLYISKFTNGLLIRGVWGLDPGSFIDDTARAISSSSIIGNLTKTYNIKIGIGIATGSCFSGLISLQGNKKFFALLGKKVNLSRLLANEAYKIIIGDTKIKYLIYCDKNTMKKSQKWYRHVYVSQLRVYLNKKNDSYYESKDDFFYSPKNVKMKKEFELDKSKSGNLKNLSDINLKNRKYSRLKQKPKSNLKRQSAPQIKKEENIDTDEEEEKEKEEKNQNLENEYHLINEIFTPIEEEEYFIPNYYDPFPLIRTHLNNSYNPKNKLYYNNLLQMTNSENIYESQQMKTRHHTMTQSSINKVQSHPKMIAKLQKSQTIFGNSKNIQKFLKVINLACKNNLRQFFLIKGPLGVGKTLFVRKCLNNFIGVNEFLSKKFFSGEPFLFCNRINPLSSTIPFNTINFLLRDIFLNIKRIDKIKDLFVVSQELKLDHEDLKNISFVLSIGKNDINLLDEFEQFNLINMLNIDVAKIIQDKQKEKSNYNPFKAQIFSVVEQLEGPFNFKNTNNLNAFFFEMIRIYRQYLNTNKDNENTISRRSSVRLRSKNKNFMKRLPLIFVIDDIHMSNKYSIEFIQYLFNRKESDLNPFIIILVEQTPFRENFRPLTHGIFENFLVAFSEYSNKPNEDKIITFDIQPLTDKENLEKLIIYYYKESVLTNYKTNLESVDDQILDFLLMKSFHGIPLLVLSLFESLIKSEKFIQILSSEFIITSELIDDNVICDWSDILLPYAYEKIASMCINSISSFKEILLLKYASIIGTVFDMKTLDKINPIKNIVKIKDLEKMILKFNNEYIIEIFTEDPENQKNKIQNIICQIAFPLMREVLHQKFPMEKRSSLHMLAAKFLSTSKKNVYFSIENELQILKRHLLYSEMKIINEIESKEIRTVQDILQNKKVLNYNNLKLYLVKEMCSKYYSNNYNGNIMEGNLEILLNGKWLKVSYFIDKRAKIFISLKNPKKVVNEFIMIIPIKDIYKNKILSKNSKTKNNLLSIYISKNSKPMEQNNKKIILFSSEQREEICKLDITINFLRVKVNYDKYVYNYGFSRFPLYKIKWYKQKSLFYYSHIEQNGITLPNLNAVNTMINLKKANASYLESFNTKLFNRAKIVKKSFNIIFENTLSIFFGKIQEKLGGKSPNENKEEDFKLIFKKENYLYKFTIPNHLQKRINRYFKNSKHIIDQINIEIYKQIKCSFRDSIIPSINAFSSLKKENNRINTSNNIRTNLINNELGKKYNTDKKDETEKSNKISSKKNNIKVSSKKILDYKKNETNSSDKNKKDNIKKEIENTSIKNSKSKTKENISLFSKENQRRIKENNNEINNKNFILSFKNRKKKDDIFVKVQKINQNEEENIIFSDIDFDSDNEINNKSFSSSNLSNILNSEEDKETNFISNKNDNDYKNKKKYNIPKKINIQNNNNYDNGILTYREKNKYNINNSNFNDQEYKDKMLNTSRENGEYHNLYQKINNKFDGYIINEHYHHKLNKKNKIPGDFVPKISNNDKTSHHVELIPTSEEETKIYIHTLTNSFNKSFNEDFNKSCRQLKYATLYDNPKYVYLDENYNNVKVHKSNLLNNKQKEK